MKDLMPGQEVETEIVAITDDTIFLDLNMKTEGVLERAEFADENGNVSVQVHDKIKVFFMGFINGEMKFTTKISGNNANKSMLENAFNSGIPIEGVVEKEIKGGYEIKIGEARAFCPFSQMYKKDKDDSVVGRHLTFKITEYKNEGKNILVSNRAIIQEEKDAKIDLLSKTVVVGNTVQGKITSLHDYGAFVDIGGFEALLPISEISAARVNDIQKVLSVGQEIKASVIKVDWKNERVSISIKALLPDPWQTITERFSVGTKIDGIISHIADFGVFVTLEPGVDGLVHISDLDVNKNTNLKKVFKSGEKMSVVIKSIDLKNKRIALETSTSQEQAATASAYMQSHKDDDSGETYNPFAAFLSK